jgi:GT2 family glycosyltransferase
MAPPDVSVITTVRDGERHLPEALASVLAQQGVHLEVVVLSDGSTDGTDAWLASVDDPRVVVRCRAHEGRTRSLNEAVGLSRGRHLAILDADDRYLPGHLAGLVARLDADEEVVAVGAAQWRFIDDEGAPLGTRDLPVADDADVRAMLRRGRIPFHHSSMAFRRSAVEELGGYDERAVHADDLDLCVQLAGVGRFAVVPVASMETRRHDQQWFGARRGRMGDLRVRVASRRVVQQHVAEVLDGPSPTAARLWSQELGAFVFWWVRRFKGERPLLPRRVRRRLDARQVR